MSRNSVRAVWPTDGAAKSSGRDRVVVLIVDESLKTRALLGSILSSLGVGTVVRSLHQLTGQGHAPGDDYLELLGVHLDTIRAVLSAEKRSDGGKVGRELVRGLHRANRKFLRAPEHGQSPSGGRRACAQPVARTGALRTATVRRDGTRDWEI